MPQERTKPQNGRLLPAIVLLGLWLFLSPWILLHYEQIAPSMNAYATGGLIAAFAGQADEDVRKVALAIVSALAGWLVISPWVLGFSQAAPLAAAAAALTGLAVLALAAAALTGRRAGMAKPA